MNKTTIPGYLFIGVYPNAYVYCDKTRQENGDFKNIAMVVFNPLSLVIKDDSPKYDEAINRAKQDYQHILDNIGQPIQISACGHTAKAVLPLKPVEG